MLVRNSKTTLLIQTNLKPYRDVISTIRIFNTITYGDTLHN